MSWPANPVNGQRVQVNGILYEFNAANETWDKIGGFPDTYIVEFLQTPNLIVTGQATFTDAGNVRISGGSNNFVLTTDGNANLSWKPQVVVTASGDNGQIQFNTGNVFDAAANFAFNKTTETLSVPRITGTLTANANAQPNITSVGNLTNLNVTGNANITGNVTANGNITANNFSGNFSGNYRSPGSNTQVLFNNQNNIGGSNNFTFASNVLTVNGNIVTNNANLGNLVTANFINGTLTVANQPNITRVGTLANLTSSGNITAPNFIGNVVGGNISGNITAPGANTYLLLNTQGNIGASANLTFADGLLNVAGNINATRISATGVESTTLQGSLTTAAQPNITSLGTLTGLNTTGHITASGNVTGANFVGNVIGGTISGTFNAPGSNTELVYNKQGFLGTSNNLKFDGSTLAVTGNASVSHTLTTGNISATNITGTLSTANQTSITRLGTLVNAQVTGNVTAGNVYANLGTIGAGFLTGTLTTNAQPNVTSLGTLTSLSVSGNLSAGNVNANITAGRVTGNTYAAPNTSSNTQVLLNNQGNISGSSNLTFNGTVLGVTGNITAGSINASNVSATLLTGTLTTPAQPNITSVGTLTELTVNSNVNVGDILTANKLIANIIETDVILGQLTAPAGLAGNNQVLFNLNGVVESSNKLLFNPLGTATLNLQGNLIANNANLGNRATANFIQGNLLTNLQPNITQVGTLSELMVDGNINISNSIILIDASTIFKGNLIPDGNMLYDLGSETNRWKDLYLSGNTIKLGDATLTSTETGGIDTGGGDFLSEVLTSTTSTLAPFTVYSNVMVANLNVEFLQGLAPSSSNLANTIAVRNEFNNFEANTITANLYGHANTATKVSDPAQPNITSVGLLTSLAVQGNIDAGNINLSGNIDAEYFKGSGQELYNINGANVSEVPLATFATDAQDAVFATSAETAQFAVNVTGCSQPNITSVGTLTSLKVTGNIEAGNLDASLGNVFAANFIGGNVSGNISGTYRAPGGTGANTEILFNKEGNIGSSEGIKFNSLTNVLTITGQFNSVNANLGNLVEANFFKGAGNNLSNIRGSNVQGEVAFAATANAVAGANVSGQVGNALVAGTVYTAAQPNITSVGTLTDLNVNSGTLTTGNPVDLLQTWNNSSVSFTGIRQVVTDTQSAAESLLIDLQQNVGGVATSRFRVNKVGNLITGNIVTGNVEGTIITAAQPFITSLGNLSSLTVTANIGAGNASLGNLARANFFQGDGSLLVNVPAGNRLQNGTSNLAIIENGNINLSIDGFSNVVTIGNVSGTYTSNFRGNLNATGNANLGNAVTANFYIGNAHFLSSIAGSNVTGHVANATHACTAGVVTNPVQSTITSLGVLTELTLGVTVNPSLGNNVSASFFTGTLTTAAQPNITSLGRLTGLTIGNTTANTRFGNGTIQAAGNIDGANINGNLHGNGNGITFINGGIVSGDVPSAITAGTAGTVTVAAQPNITSVGTLTSLTTSGNVSVGNNLSVTGNLTVLGTTITANATTLSVRDPIIQQGGNTSGGALTTNDGRDRGQLLHYFTTTAVDAFMGWDNSNAEFAFGSSVSVTNEVVTFNNYGNIRAGFFIGNGSQLTGIVPPNRILNGSSNVLIPSSDSNVTISANNVANIVQVYGMQGGTTGNGMSVAGNVDIGTNFFKGNGALLTGLQLGSIISNGTSNVSLPTSGGNVTMSVGGVANVLQINSAGNLEIKGRFIAGAGSGGNIDGANVITANSFVGNLINGTSNIRIAQNGNVGISANGISNTVIISGGLSNILTVAGNVDIGSNWYRGNGALLTGISTSSISNGTSNVNIPSSAGNVNISVGGTANILAVSSSGINVTGTANVSSQLISTVATGTAPLQVTSTTRVANLNVNYANVSDFEAVTIATTGTYYPTFINGITAGNYAAFANASLSFNAATGALSATSFTGNLTNGTSNVNIISSGGNVTVSVGGTANVVQITSTGILGTFIGSSDIITNYAVASITHSFLTSTVISVSGATGALALTLTDLPTTINRAIVIPVIVAHGATAMTYPTSISINGVAGQTINYLQGSTPTARTNKTEVLGLTLIRTNAGAWNILASVSSYG